MEHKDYLEFAKEKFLKEKAYGKYDYLDKIFSKETLMTTKPRLLRDYLSKTLSIDIDKIPIKTFYSWLSRYRKRNNSTSEKSTAAVKTNDISDWRNFVPSEPVKVKEKPLIRFPYKEGGILKEDHEA